MPRKNTRVFILVLIVFILAALVVLPINGGILLGKGVRLGLDLQGGVHIVYRADFTTVEPGEEGNAIEGAMAILQNRINPLGVTEPLIQKQGNDRIVIELPGLDITDKEKESLSRVVMLEFGEMVTGNETARWENSAGSWKPAMAFIDGEEKTLTSRYFRENTFVRQADFGGLELIFDWDEEGSELSGIITERLIGQRLGIFEGDEALLGEDRRPIAPTVQATITDRGVITGLSPAGASGDNLRPDGIADTGI